MKATKTFYQKVDLRSRSQMIEFLTNHFRYDTMNSWNRSTSWANNLKVYNVIPNELQDKVHEMMESEDFYFEINELIADYNLTNNYALQAGFNGRSGGYLVMYSGGYETKRIFTFDNSTTNEYGERDYADGYGWMNIEEAKKRGLYNKEVKRVYTQPGLSIDDYDEEDYKEMEMDELREIVRKVQEFDKLCDAIVESVISMAENCDVEEETYFVEKKRKLIA